MKMLIGGKLVDARDGAVIPVYNPATGEQLDTVPKATCEDVQLALDCARDGFSKWSALTLNKRLEIMYRFIDLLRERREDVEKLLCAEGGKAIATCRGEVDETIMLFQGYCEKARTLEGQILPLNAEERGTNDLILVVREPLGVICAITPFNFPAELFAHKVAPALVTGNAVIMKPASETPLTSLYLASLLIEAGVEPNAIQVVTGSGATVGKWLSESEKVNAVTLTGSTEVGSSIMQYCSKHISRCYLELGGNDPQIVMEDCDLDAAVEAAVGGRCHNAGQTCCANKRFLIQNSVYDEFAAKLVDALKKVKYGDPTQDDTVYGPLINAGAAQLVREQIEYTVAQGAICVLGGNVVNGTYVEPTVLTGVTEDMSIAKDMEVFGPVFPLIGFDTPDDAVRIANNSSYGLSSGICTKDIKLGMKMAACLESGSCVIGGNGNYRTAQQPFGGHKKSGIGVEGISHTLEEMTQLKNVVLQGIYAD